MNGSATVTAGPLGADWRTRAACLGQWADMHPDNDEHQIERAKQICKRCPVKAECFWDAVRTGDNEHGVRAGLRPNERRAVVKEVERRKADTADSDDQQRRTGTSKVAA